MIKLYNNPIVGIPIIEPDNSPQPGDILLGYEILYNEDNIFTKPRPKYMKTRGWAAAILLCLCFWPATCVPCCMTCSYDTCQRPVYGRTFFPNYVILRSVDFKKELKECNKNSESKNKLEKSTKILKTM